MIYSHAVTRHIEYYLSTQAHGAQAQAVDCIISRDHAALTKLQCELAEEVHLEVEALEEPYHWPLVKTRLGASLAIASAATIAHDILHLVVL